MARGSITRRGNSWTVRVDLGPDPQTGKRRQRRETFRTRKEAEKRLAELVVLAEQGQLGASTRMTVAEYLERWLEDYANSVAPKTLSTYTSLVRSYVTPALGTLSLAKLTPTHLVRFFSTLREKPRADGREGLLSPATVHAVYRLLRTALNTAVRWQLLPRNPMDGVEPPRIARKEMRALDVAQARQFLAAAAEESPRWHAFFAMLVHTGCRPGELKALRWEDVDLAAGTVRICRHVQRLPGQGFVEGATKTASGRRTLALGPELVALLRRHRATQAAERLQLGPLWQDNDLVFPSQVGTYLEDKPIRRAFARILERAGLPWIRLYDLRHSAATLLLANGVDLKTVAERLGHASPTLVLTTYGHTLPGAQAAASRRLEELLKGAI